MWQALTLKKPWAGRNFMGVATDILEGQRPPIPTDTPAAFRTLLEQCWHELPKKRPSIADVSAALEAMLMMEESPEGEADPASEMV